MSGRRNWLASIGVDDGDSDDDRSDGFVPAESADMDDSELAAQWLDHGSLPAELELPSAHHATLSELRVWLAALLPRITPKLAGDLFERENFTYLVHFYALHSRAESVVSTSCRPPYDDPDVVSVFCRFFDVLVAAFGLHRAVLTEALLSDTHAASTLRILDYQSLCYQPNETPTSTFPLRHHTNAVNAAFARRRLNALDLAGVAASILVLSRSLYVACYVKDEILCHQCDDTTLAQLTSIAIERKMEIIDACGEHAHTLSDAIADAVEKLTPSATRTTRKRKRECEADTDSEGTEVHADAKPSSLSVTPPSTTSASPAGSPLLLRFMQDLLMLAKSATPTARGHFVSALTDSRIPAALLACLASQPPLRPPLATLAVSVMCELVALHPASLERFVNAKLSASVSPSERTSEGPNLLSVLCERLRQTRLSPALAATIGVTLRQLIEADDSAERETFSLSTISSAASRALLQRFYHTEVAEFCRWLDTHGRNSEAEPESVSVVAMVSVLELLQFAARRSQQRAQSMVAERDVVGTVVVLLQPVKQAVRQSDSDFRSPRVLCACVSLVAALLSYGHRGLHCQSQLIEEGLYRALLTLLTSLVQQHRSNLLHSAILSCLLALSESECRACIKHVHGSLHPRRDIFDPLAVCVTFAQRVAEIDEREAEARSPQSLQFANIELFKQRLDVEAIDSDSDSHSTSSSSGSEDEFSPTRSRTTTASTAVDEARFDAAERARAHSTGRHTTTSDLVTRVEQFAATASVAATATKGAAHSKPVITFKFAPRRHTDVDASNNSDGGDR